jgi:hypothetical protein
MDLAGRFAEAPSGLLQDRGWMSSMSWNMAVLIFRPDLEDDFRLA